MAEETIGNPQIPSDGMDTVVEQNLSQRAAHAWSYPPITLLTTEARRDLADIVTAAGTWEQLDPEYRIMIETAEELATFFDVGVDAGEAWTKLYGEAQASMTLAELLAVDHDAN